MSLWPWAITLRTLWLYLSVVAGFQCWDLQTAFLAFWAPLTLLSGWVTLCVIRAHFLPFQAIFFANVARKRADKSSSVLVEAIRAQVAQTEASLSWITVSRAEVCAHVNDLFGWMPVSGDPKMEEFGVQFHRQHFRWLLSCPSNRICKTLGILYFANQPETDRGSWLHQPNHAASDASCSCCLHGCLTAGPFHKLF